MLPIAPSVYYEFKARQADPSRRAARQRRDAELMSEIQRVWSENQEAYGVLKTWKQLRRERIPAARYTVGRLMGKMGLRGVVRGSAFTITTRPEGLS